MPKTSRREFLTFAGAATIGMAFSEKKTDKISSTKSFNNFIDPWLEINTKNIVWNVAQVRKRVNNRPIMAVIKCNAYGHGLVAFAKVLKKQNIKHFAVVKVQEAKSLRENGINEFILNFGPFTQQDAEYIVKNNISQSVFSDEVEKLAKAAYKFNKKAKVHIKVDTGLGRVGVPHYRAMPFIEKVASLPVIVIEGIYTTLTEELDFDKVQVNRLLQICNKAKEKGISVGIRHAASSLGVAKYPGSFLDMVRPGNCLFGLEPLPNMDLKQSMSLKTRVIYIKKMYPGETVAYHRRLKIKKETLMATLPLGYSDGYPYRGVGKAEVLINGERWTMVAYMSANHVTVDITGSKGIKMGDEVVLLGTQKGQTISNVDVSKWGESTVYKTAIGMSPLLPRIYI